MAHRAAWSSVLRHGERHESDAPRTKEVLKKREAKKEGNAKKSLDDGSGTCTFRRPSPRRRFRKEDAEREEKKRSYGKEPGLTVL